MIAVAVVGASGYSGAELLRLLSVRKDVLVKKTIASSSVGKRIDELYPAYAGRIDGIYESLEPDNWDDIDVAFVALPSGEAMKAVPHVLRSASRVIDLSGDFRLQDPTLYEQYYPHKHSATELLSEAVYGLPELNHDAITQAHLVANPGCYATSIILALAPLLHNGIIQSSGIVVNALSGVSGAGRSSSVELSFTEVNENVRAYKIGNHQHIPEIEMVLGSAAGKNVQLEFIPHLIPVTRGIYATIHAALERSVSFAEVEEVFQSFYRTAPFVRIKKNVPQIRDVVYTNYCDIWFSVNQRTNRITVISTIDNLLKGAAGQAVQNMNLMFGLSQEYGLQ